MNADMQKLMEEFQARFDASVKAQENALKDAQQQFESTLADAKNQLAKAINVSEIKEEEEPSEVKKVPAAAWINAPDGEKMMVLNQEAVVMFLAIFERISDVA